MDNIVGKYCSGNNEVSLVGADGNYSVITNGVPVFRTEMFPEALTRYYKDISTISSAQRDNPDLTMGLFGSEVVRMNRMIIPRLAQLGKSKEVRYLKALTTQLEDIIKYEPHSALIGGLPILQDDMNQGRSENNTKPSREIEGKPKRVVLKEANTGMQPFQEENLEHIPVEKPIKIASTYQQKLHPKEQRALRGETVEPVYLHKDEHDEEEEWLRGIEEARPRYENMSYEDTLEALRQLPNKNRPVKSEAITNTVPYVSTKNPILNMRKARMGKDEAFDIGRKLGINFNKISLDEFAIGLPIEFEHKDIIDHNPLMAGKIAWAHLREVPDYYTKLNKYVEKSLRKDFDKMYEGEQAHENVGFENKDIIGRKSPPIEGKKMEKAAFSVDAPTVVNGETQEPIDIRKEDMVAGQYSKPFPDNQPEVDNMISHPKKIVLRRQNLDGGDVQENGGEFFKTSLDIQKRITSLIEESNG